jgi:hypothetical protein
VTDPVALLLVGRWSGLSTMLGGPIRPPRLVTAEQAAEAAGSVAAGPGPWLIGLACLGAVLTIAWWVWWGIRFHKARLDPYERTFRSLARTVGLGTADRELVRTRAREANRDPIEVLATGIDAEILFAGQGPAGRRVCLAIGDTNGSLGGTP